MYGGSNYHMFNEMSMLTYIKPVKCNVEILNVSKDTEKVFGIIIIKIPPQISLYYSGYHTIFHETHKKVKLNSNITTNLQSSELRQ